MGEENKEVLTAIASMNEQTQEAITKVETTLRGDINRVEGQNTELFGKVSDIEKQMTDVRVEAAALAGEKQVISDLKSWKDSIQKIISLEDLKKMVKRVSGLHDFKTRIIAYGLAGVLAAQFGWYWIQTNILHIPGSPPHP